ncbi:MAG: type II toxin-antitoxin system RelE/ParE family toxin [Simkaniaceae bacterium]|nr:type II toxin-antitoxin system RelE/ParE family toxin [Simkaniaceae bacterium]
MSKKQIKTVLWISSAKRDLMKMPAKAISDLGYAIYEAQKGNHPRIAKPLKGFSGTEVLELVENFRGDTFRAVYTIKYHDVLIVLHAFEKKSTKGISTPKKEIDLIHERLKHAKQVYEDWKKEKG